MSPNEHISNNEEDVDVEQWSDGEDQKSSQSPVSQSSLETNSNKNPTQSPEEIPKKKKKEDKPKFLKPKCNSEELLGVDCFLETKELWDKFNELGTEMIITKTGRYVKEFFIMYLNQNLCYRIYIRVVLPYDRYLSNHLNLKML